MESSLGPCLVAQRHFLGKYAAIKAMGSITQAADGAHLGLAAERKLTGVVMFCAVAKFLLFF